MSSCVVDQHEKDYKDKWTMLTNDSSRIVSFCASGSDAVTASHLLCQYIVRYR